jgi:large subunit ribosomal protein L18e
LIGSFINEFLLEILPASDLFALAGRYILLGRKMKTKSKIEKQLNKKTNPQLVETLLLIKKNDPWRKLLGSVSGSRRKRLEVNLEKINSFSKEGETIVIPGKVLSIGQLDKKIRVVALGFSENAKEKLLKAKSEVISIAEEIKKNPSAKEVKILK